MGFLGKIAVGRRKRFATDMRILTGDLKTARYDQKMLRQADSAVMAELKAQKQLLPRTRKMHNLIRKIEEDMNVLMVDVKYGLEAQRLAMSSNKGIYGNAAAEGKKMAAIRRLRFSEVKANKMIAQIESEMNYIFKIINQEFGVEAFTKGQISKVVTWLNEAHKRVSTIKQSLNVSDLDSVKTLQKKVPI